MSYYQEKIRLVEAQLRSTMDKIQHLTQELENNALQEEEVLRREIEELRQELTHKEQFSTSTQTSLSQIDGQLHALDVSIGQQKEEISLLEDELRSTNMNDFRYNPEMIRHTLERELFSNIFVFVLRVYFLLGRSATAILPTQKLSPSLPSSARSTPTKRPLIFNADTLKEAVATSTTDTLWV
jgi:hypothetical protein